MSCAEKFRLFRVQDREGDRGVATSAWCLAALEGVTRTCTPGAARVLGFSLEATKLKIKIKIKTKKYLRTVYSL